MSADTVDATTDLPDYVESANLYRAAGWAGPVPLPPGEKWPPPKDATGWTGIYPSGADSWTWFTEPPRRHADGKLDADFRGTSQVGLRLGAVLCDGVEWDVIGIDVDHYGDKFGAYTLASAALQWGELPAAPRSSARGIDNPSGIRFFRVPAGATLATKVQVPSGHTDRDGKPIIFGDIEVIQRSHRYAVVWPSIHPSGPRYTWWGRTGAIGIPNAAQLPLLPQRWLDALAREATPGKDPATVEQVNAFARTHSHNPGNTSAIKGMVRLFEREAASGSRHDAGLDAACMAAREARAGHYPAEAGRRALREAFLRSTTAPAKGGQRQLTPQAAQTEFGSLWSWGVGQALALTVEECRARTGAHPGGAVLPPARKLGSSSTGLGSPNSSLENPVADEPVEQPVEQPAAPAAEDVEPAPTSRLRKGTVPGASTSSATASSSTSAASTAPAAPRVVNSDTVHARVTPPRLVAVDGETVEGHDDTFAAENALEEAYADLERAEQHTIMARALDLGSAAAAKAEWRQRTNDEVRSRLAAENAADAPPALSLVDFLDIDDEPVQYRIEGLATTGARVMLAAQYKAGKSTTIGNLIRALADGVEFLGRSVAPPEGRIVLLDNELDERMLRRWLREQRIERADRVQVVSLRGRVSSFNILDRAIRAQWATALREAGSEDGYVILDCLRPLVDSLGLSEDKDAGRVLVAFDELLAECGAGEGLVVHHMGHNGTRVRGDSRLQDWPDVMWRLLRADDDDPASRRSFVAYGRDVDVPEFGLAYDRETRRLSPAGEDVELLAPEPAWDGPMAEELDLELRAYAGPGKDAVKPLARFMRHHASGDIGVNLTDAYAALTSPTHVSARRHNRATVKRAWDALRGLGWIVPSDVANGSQNATGHMVWSDPPQPPGTIV